MENNKGPRTEPCETPLDIYKDEHIVFDLTKK